MRRRSVKVDQSLLARALGEALRAARRRVGLTQAEVGARSGVGVEVYARVEQGREPFRIRMLLRICRVLGIAADALLPDLEESAHARCEARRPPKRARPREREGQRATSTRARRTRDTFPPGHSMVVILLVPGGPLPLVISSLPTQD